MKLDTSSDLQRLGCWVSLHLSTQMRSEIQYSSCQDDSILSFTALPNLRLYFRTAGVTDNLVHLKILVQTEMARHRDPALQC